jgi:putative colanic acid biosynthesis UDP-glucose lipid carrier transferase
MTLSHQGNTMLLTVRNEPLEDPLNRFIKRSFDIIVSGTFLLTLFPIIYAIVGIIIKRQSPGPILFKQKRNGLDAREFSCLKFRSMHVNDEADSVQATEHDPRKFAFGNFMRKTNIDELPQLINVFKGDMSLVGPRPHMLLHTQEYSHLIKQYMVRHIVKPGLTGWAQSLGLRGETKTLQQMEDRVKADIWYVENWSFFLDIRIIWRTAMNMLKRNEKNAY